MTIALACICGRRDDVASQPAAPVTCPVLGCGGRMYAVGGEASPHALKPWVIGTQSNPDEKGPAHV